MSKFKVPDYIRSLITAARTVYGRHEYSDAVDQALRFLEALPLLPMPAPVERLLDEQRFLLPGFRFTVMLPGRVGGKISPIVSRNYFGNILGYIEGTNVAGAIKHIDESFGGIHPAIYAEMCVLIELFPELLGERALDVPKPKENEYENWYWQASRQKFEPKLNAIGARHWAANDWIKQSFYLSLQPQDDANGKNQRADGSLRLVGNYLLRALCRITRVNIQSVRFRKFLRGRRNEGIP